MNVVICPLITLPLKSIYVYFQKKTKKKIFSCCTVIKLVNFMAIFFFGFSLLTNFSLETPKKSKLANSADPDQTPHPVAADQDLHCLQIV